MSVDAPSQIVGRLDLELLTAFVTIVDCGSFKRTAVELNLTQSGVSMQMKRLEERVGRRLLRRHARHVELTAEGRLLYEYARRIVELVDEARTQLSTPEITGCIRVGLPEWFAGYRLQRPLADFGRQHPEIRLEMVADSSNELRKRVADGSLDLALAITDRVKQAPTPIYRERLVWVVSDGHGLDVKEDMPLALFAPPCPYRDVAIDGLAACGWRGREVFTSTSVASVRTAVETGLGISVFPESAVRPGLRVLSSADGFPDLPDTAIGIYKSTRVRGTPAELLCTYLEEALGTVVGLPPPD